MKELRAYTIRHDTSMKQVIADLVREFLKREGVLQKKHLRPESDPPQRRKR